ncbi:hypothetical protein EWM64_g6780 [Hericium alpestre]|uniref:Cytochrome P450 n=1 Tax=Hericium alpestre TaxID=135208 RepID=A0A4Y9ZR34_9AGAM|nr:hypothetical protein EWM64_g6780 [Hericium alpestre]
MGLSSDIGFLVLSSALLGVCTHVWLNRFEPVAPTKVLSVLLAASATILLLHNLSFAPSFLTIFTSYAAYLLSLTLSLVIYRLSPLHPLAKYPGPPIATLTDFWGAWQFWNGHQHTVTKALRDRYGPIIRVAPNKLSIVDVDIVSFVLSTTGLPKGQSYDTRQDPNAPGNLFVLKGKEHAARRRLWTRGMNPESLKEYEGILRARVSQLVDRLGEVSTGGALDIATWLGYSSFDFTGDMAFGGVGYELMKAGSDEHSIWDVILNSNRTGAVLGHMPWATKLFILIPGFFTDLLKLRKMGIQFATARLKKGSTVKDLWHHLADDANLEKTKPSFGNVVADGAFTIVEGSDTSTTVLTAFFYYMLQHPEYMREVQAEIDGVYARGGDAFDELKNAANVPFLTA